MTFKAFQRFKAFSTRQSNLERTIGASGMLHMVSKVLCAFRIEIP
ncbi:hypothetical protein MTBBW1_1170005 [Desulfamplus magnetovallimortis]|uniref:Uncharacterized protein n=1 Tax=Desulfamplus magnetovallimortis TaxID=1246637 RepID=A0A1W1H5U8_9BACT|nr:hypothetical protein MTBBW1_1170005 [Desulfamplus magnetovallimortis]